MSPTLCGKSGCGTDRGRTRQLEGFERSTDQGSEQRPRREGRGHCPMRDVCRRGGDARINTEAALLRELSGVAVREILQESSRQPSEGRHRGRTEAFDLLFVASVCVLFYQTFFPGRLGHIIVWLSSLYSITSCITPLTLPLSFKASRT